MYELLDQDDIPHRDYFEKYLIIAFVSELILGRLIRYYPYNIFVCGLAQMFLFAIYMIITYYLTTRFKEKSEKNILFPLSIMVVLGYFLMDLLSNQVFFKVDHWVSIIVHLIWIVGGIYILRDYLRYKYSKMWFIVLFGYLLFVIFILPKYEY